MYHKSTPALTNNVPVAQPPFPLEAYCIARTKLTVSIQHILIGHVQVALCYGQRGVAENFLQDNRRAAIAYEICRRTIPYEMWV